MWCERRTTHLRLRGVDAGCGPGHLPLQLRQQQRSSRSRGQGTGARGGSWGAGIPPHAALSWGGFGGSWPPGLVLLGAQAVVADVSCQLIQLPSQLQFLHVHLDPQWLGRDTDWGLERISPRDDMMVSVRFEDAVSSAAFGAFKGSKKESHRTSSRFQEKWPNRKLLEILN